MNMNLEGEIDFIIKNVKKNDIIKVLNNESKKYFVFGDQIYSLKKIMKSKN